MGKYEPLNAFLKGRHDEEVIPMTFIQIERVLGSQLPPSKKQRAWWSNNPTNNVMTKEWLDAGFETEAVDVVGEKLVFRRIANVEGQMEPMGFGEAPQAEFMDGPVKPLHPGFGLMKGLMTVEPGYDLTEPAFPDWEQYEEAKYGKHSKLHE